MGDGCGEEGIDFDFPTGTILKRVIEMVNIVLTTDWEFASEKGISFQPDTLTSDAHQKSACGTLVEQTLCSPTRLSTRVD